MQGVGVARKSLAIIVPLWLRIRVPGGHDRREVAISETIIPTLAKELLSVKPKFVLCSGRQAGDPFCLLSFVFRLFSFDFRLFSFDFRPFFAPFFIWFFPKVAQRSPKGRP